jgi:isopentenyl diphosphate isomerase/L-lactate dehydrogenase-like FMN-dependent dehydrogenase
MGVFAMKTYEFDVILKDVPEISDEQADALYAAGCDDATPASSNGVAWIHFDRAASTLEDAIRSSVAQVQKAGMIVARVEITADAAAALRD